MSRDSVCVGARKWQLGRVGAGEAQFSDGEIRLSLPRSDSRTYHDAQLTDYAVADALMNQPPLRLRLEARAEGPIRGTAGFGFWNQTFVPGSRRFRLPQAIWFLYGSPPNDIALAHGVAGTGWKAATINARRWQFLALLPFAPLGFLMMRRRLLYDALWRTGQRAIGVSEAALDESLLQDYHSYAIEWRRERALFSVDGEIVLRAPVDIGGPLGFIAWVDNQYAIVSPQGRFGWGRLDLPESQGLRLRDISIVRL